MILSEITIDLDLLQSKYPLIYTENLLKKHSDSLVESLIFKKNSWVTLPPRLAQ